MAELKYEVVATLGTYTDRDGNEKKRYQKCGVVFESDEGLSIKLDTIPVSQDWNGWLSLYPPKQREQSAPAQQPSTKTDPFADDGSGESDIPF